MQTLRAFDAKLSELSVATWDDLGSSNVYDQMGNGASEKIQGLRRLDGRRTDGRRTDDGRTDGRGSALRQGTGKADYLLRDEAPRPPQSKISKRVSSGQTF